jgi:hypothetical protein
MTLHITNLVFEIFSGNFVEKFRSRLQTAPGLHVSWILGGWLAGFVVVVFGVIPKNSANSARTFNKLLVV